LTGTERPFGTGFGHDKTPTKVFVPLQPRLRAAAWLGEEEERDERKPGRALSLSDSVESVDSESSVVDSQPVRRDLQPCNPDDFEELVPAVFTQKSWLPRLTALHRPLRVVPYVRTLF
jgi:hypothetical protein